MNDHIRERILRKLDGIPDDRAYQVLDYIEFLESKYAANKGTAASLLTRFSEGVEDTMRAGKVSTAAIAETMGLLNKAMGVLNGVAAAGKSVASDIVNVATRPGGNGETSAPPPPTDRPQSTATPPSDSSPGS